MWNVICSSFPRNISIYPPKESVRFYKTTSQSGGARLKANENGRCLDFAMRWFDIGANDVEHADHDGSASPDTVYRYYSMLMDVIDNPNKHIIHFHTTPGCGLANVLAVLQAGMTNFESTMGRIGGQPANFVSGVQVSVTGEIILQRVSKCLFGFY